MGDGSNSDRGVPVLHIAEGSPAHIAGVRQGDVVVYYNGQAVNDLSEYLAAMRRPSENRIQTVGVLRNNELLTFAFVRSSDWVGGPKEPS